jgi:hypothetical protein
MVLLVDDVTRVAERTLNIAKQSIYIGLGASFFFDYSKPWVYTTNNWSSSSRSV